MIEVQFRGLQKLRQDLERFPKAVSHAVRNGLNDAAFQARREWQGELKQKLVLRNTWTTRTLGVVKARGNDLDTMEARVGSPEAYLAKQEFGGTQGGPVPTLVSSGEGRGAPPRKRLVRQGNKLSQIALGQKYRRGSRKQRNAVAINMATRTGKKFIFLELERSRGIFRVSGGKRNPQIDLVWNAMDKSHRVPAHPTLGPAVRRIERVLPSIMTKAVTAQLKRQRLLGF